MNTVTVQTMRQQICQAVDTLPDEAIAELVAYVESLRDKFDAGQAETRPPFTPVNLTEGVLYGYDFSPQLVAGERRVMWPDPCS
jgi:hypothetical protein